MVRRAVGLVFFQEMRAMFEIGDLVVYGGEGVCRVEYIGPADLPGADKEKLYYRLAPLGRNGQVLTPVDTRVLLRTVISDAQARDLVASLPALEPEELPATNMRGIKEFYHDVVMSYDCERMAKLIKMVYRKRRWSIEHGKKVSQLDERYLKRAEDQFYGEMSVVLGMDRRELEQYIRGIYPQWPE